MMDNKKGQAWQTMAFAIAIGVVTLAVLAILLSAFTGDTTIMCDSGYTYNSSANECYSNANHSVTADITAAGEVSQNGLGFLDNTTSQFSTAGTVLGIGILLLIIGALGLGGYGAYRKYR